MLSARRDALRQPEGGSVRGNAAHLIEGLGYFLGIEVPELDAPGHFLGHSDGVIAAARREVAAQMVG
jgi:hypothetical protein